MTATKEQVTAYLECVKTVAVCIRELKEVPSGHLYARLMSKMSLENYQGIIDFLRDKGFITVSRGHLITWIGV
jgi:hypothetical protein